MFAIGCPGVAIAALVLFEDINAFRAATEPTEHLLLFRTDKSGSEAFDSTFKVRSGDYFSDLVSFSSPSSGSPDSVLWRHFDGEDGGVGSTPNLLTPLRLDFASPVSSVGFRNRGIQPEINVQYFGTEGQFLGEMVAIASSFVGATSTDPIAFVLVQADPPLPISGQSLQPAFITALHFNSAIPEPSTALIWIEAVIGALCVAGHNSLPRREGGREPPSHSAPALT